MFVEYIYGEAFCAESVFLSKINSRYWWIWKKKNAFKVVINWTVCIIKTFVFMLKIIGYLLHKNTYLKHHSLRSKKQINPFTIYLVQSTDLYRFSFDIKNIH